MISVPTVVSYLPLAPLDVYLETTTTNGGYNNSSMPEFIPLVRRGQILGRNYHRFVLTTKPAKNITTDDASLLLPMWTGIRIHNHRLNDTLAFVGCAEIPLRRASTEETTSTEEATQVIVDVWYLYEECGGRHRSCGSGPAAFRTRLYVEARHGTAAYRWGTVVLDRSEGDTPHCFSRGTAWHPDTLAEQLSHKKNTAHTATSSSATPSTALPSKPYFSDDEHGLVMADVSHAECKRRFQTHGSLLLQEVEI